MWYIVISLSNSPFFIIYIFELDLLWDYLFSFRGSLWYFWNYRKGEWDCQKLETSGRYLKFSLTFIENYVVTTVCGLYNTPVATISASSVRSHTHTHTPPSPTGPLSVQFFQWNLLLGNSLVGLVYFSFRTLSYLPFLLFKVV